MKKIIVFFSAFLLLAGISAFAQKKTSDSRATMLADSMKVNLNLNDEQYSKVKEINLDFMNKAKELKGGAGDKKARATELKGWAEERDMALEKVLTKEQFSTYKANKQAHRKEMKGHRRKKAA